MIVGKLTGSWDHGVETNRPSDLGIDTVPTEAPNGGKIRGIGTKYRTPEDEIRDKELTKLYSEVARAFMRQFLRSPIPGLYVLDTPDAARKFLTGLNPDPRLNMRAVTYILEAGERNTQEIEDWIESIRNQMKIAPLGRAQEAKAEGLDIIERLASCPVIAQDTQNKIKGLVAQARLETLSREEFKRCLAETPIEIEMSAVMVNPNRGFVDTEPRPEFTDEMLAVAPRRAPVQVLDEPVKKLYSADDIPF